MGDNRELLLLNSKRYKVARNKNGARLIKVTPRASQPGDPGGVTYRDWIPWGHDFTSREEQGVLGPEYHDGTDGRWEHVDTLGPQINSLTLSTHDAVSDIVDSANCAAVVQAVWGTSYAYIGRGTRPAKIDLSDMTLVNGGASLPRPITDLIVTVADGERQDRLAEIGRVVDGTQLNGAWNVIASPDGSYLYVSVSVGNRFTVVDVSDPTTPVVVGTITDATNIPAGAAGMAMSSSGRYVYLTFANANRFTVVDVLNPTAPAVAGSVQEATNLASARGVAVSANGNYAYVAVATGTRFTVVDVSTPAAPAVAGTVSDAALSSPLNVAVSANGNYAYVSCDDRLTVIDVTNPASPSVSGSVLDAATLALGTDLCVSADGSYAYVLARDVDKLTVVNVTVPASPSVTGNVTLPSGTQLTDIALSVDGKYVYALDSSPRVIMAVSVVAPSAPSVVSSLSVSSATGTIFGLVVSAAGGYIATALETSDGISLFAWSPTELAAGQGDYSAYQVLPAVDIGEPSDADVWAANSAGEPARIFGLDTKQVIAAAGNTIKTNILLGSVTMAAPNWQLVSTLTGRRSDIKFTGFAIDGNLWMLGTKDGPYYIEEREGEFRALIPEIESSDENCRQMTTWYPMGVVVPLRDGIRNSQALAGESWGPERFLGNSSPVQGYPTGVGTSLKWLVTAIENEITGVAWLVAWRPRQVGDRHPYPFSPYVIGKVPSSAASRFVQYVGYADGRRTTPAWMAGSDGNAIWWLDGRTSRFIDDTSYRYILAGTTYMAELYLDGVLADIEAVEFMTDDCTANLTVTPKISIDGGANYISLAAQTTDGFHRVLAVNGAVPHASLQGANRIKVALTYASNVATAAPKVISPVRVYWRWRPAVLNDYEYTLELDETGAEQPTAKEQQANLITAWGSAPVAVEDPDNGSYYVRVNSVEVTERRDDGGNVVAGERGSTRIATIRATEWKVTA